MEKTNRDLIYCQKVLQLLEDLAKVEQNIEFFRSILINRAFVVVRVNLYLLNWFFHCYHSGRGLFQTIIFSVTSHLSLYLVVFCLLFRYDSRKFEKKLSLEQESVRRKESLASELKKLKEEEEKFKKELNHFERIPAEFKTIETVSHMIRYMKRGEAQTLEEALYFGKWMKIIIQRTNNFTDRTVGH